MNVNSFVDGSYTPPKVIIILLLQFKLSSSLNFMRFSCYRNCIFGALLCKQQIFTKHSHIDKKTVDWTSHDKTL